MGVDEPFMRPALLKQSLEQDTSGFVRRMWALDKMHKKLHDHKKGK
jgi:hypothetical protein